MKQFFKWLFHKNEVAWSEYLKAYITCVFYINDNHWYFTYKDNLNNRNIMKAGTKYSYFKWERF